MSARTLTLTYDPARQAFRCRGLYFGLAGADEFDAMAEWLGRKLCDSPAAQSALGVLGADVVRFKEGRTPK